MKQKQKELYNLAEDALLTVFSYHLKEPGYVMLKGVYKSLWLRHVSPACREVFVWEHECPCQVLSLIIQSSEHQPVQMLLMFLFRAEPQFFFSSFRAGINVDCSLGSKYLLVKHSKSFAKDSVL